MDFVCVDLNKSIPLRAVVLSLSVIEGIMDNNTGVANLSYVDNSTNISTPIVEGVISSKVLKNFDIFI